jgi:hypothetical protein
VCMQARHHHHHALFEVLATINISIIVVV